MIARISYLDDPFSFVVMSESECNNNSDKIVYGDLCIKNQINPQVIQVCIGNTVATKTSLTEAIQATIDEIEKDMPLNDIDLDHLVDTALKMKVDEFKSYDEIVNFVFDYLAHCY